MSRDWIIGPRLAEWRDAIDQVLGWDAERDTGTIDCLWDQLEVRGEPIRDGVRLTLPGCPNA